MGNESGAQPRPPRGASSWLWIAAVAFIFSLACFAWFWGRHLAVGQSVPERFALEEVEDSGFITVYQPRHADGAAMVICPGGGYGGLVLDAEGEQVAHWLNRHGIIGVVLEYRCPHGQPNRPLADVQAAIRLVRQRAAEWGVRTNQVGVIGFSAGGHLASMAATLPDMAAPDGPARAVHLSSRPDFAVLVYPVICMDALADAGSRLNLLGPEPSSEQITAYSTDRRVTRDTSPAFLVHARDDAVVGAENSRRFHASLQAQGIPSAFLQMESGGHGLGYGGPLWAEWQAQALTWLRAQHLIASDAAGE